MPYQPFCWQMWPYSVIEGERIPVPDWLERNGFFKDLGYTIKGQMTEGFAQYVAGVFKSQRMPVVRSGNLVLVPVFERYLLYDELPDGNASAMDVFANHLPPDYPNWAAMSQEMRVRIRDLTDHPFGRERFRSGVFGDCEAARALIMENDGW